jgi:pimeloyl-ACP methyl ester carboxylesterase
MKKQNYKFHAMRITILLIVTILTSHTALAQSTAALTILNRDGAPVDAITDGDRIQLRLSLPATLTDSAQVQFLLEDSIVATCVIPAGAAECATDPFLSLGWHWTASGAAMPERTLRATTGGQEAAVVTLPVAARPVVMVHGFVSTWEAWTTYLGPQGYLALAGIPGYAVGDGQVPGALNTGSLDDPAGRTNTIHQNAEVVGQYIAAVKKATGAEMVDLLAHSMGGLISRYYIDRVMPGRDVAQLIMLGSPMAGTECANLPASLGLYLPATLEIRPSYVLGIFNQQVTHRHGIAFNALAGNPIHEAFKSPCTSTPTDIAVSQASVNAIPLESTVMPLLHTDLNTAQVVFDEFVLPLLSQGPGEYPEQPDVPAAASAAQPLQFSRVYTGHIDPGQTEEFVITIEDGVTVASFSLFDTTHSLQTRVQGASGNTIDLTSENNGLVVVDDPAVMFYLGYGFNNPRPGQWRVTLLTSETTPSAGADYALTAYMLGGGVVDASALPLLPQVGEPVALQASLSLNAVSVPVQAATARIQAPDGQVTTQEMLLEDGQAVLELQADLEGLYGIDLLVSGALPSGAVVERTSFLSFQAQPSAPPTRSTLLVGVLLALGCLLALILGAAGLLFLRRRTRRARNS